VSWGLTRGFTVASHLQQGPEQRPEHYRARQRAFLAGLTACAFLVGLGAGVRAAEPEAAVVAPAPAPAAEAGETKPGPLAPCPGSIGGVVVAPLAAGLANDIRARIEKRVGGNVLSVCRMPFGLFEVMVDDEVLYVDERATYLLAGNAFDLRTQENITARRKEDAIRVDFRALPLQLAVKTVRGNGTRVVAVFEDPNCPYCKRFEKDIASLTDTTIYTFLYPILSRDHAAADDSYPKSRAIWCAPDRTQAWAQVMLEGKHLPAAPESCANPLDEILKLGQKLHITGTPTLLFTDGRRAPGAIPLERVEKMIAEAQHPPLK